MKRYIVLSVNDDPEYLQYVPLTVWSWQLIGWEVILLYYGSVLSKSFNLINEHATFNGHFLNKIDGYRGDTITQISRLYGASTVKPNDMVMLGDIDMLALSDYWKPSPELMTIYGHDLTDFRNIPMCYVAMIADKWDHLIDYTDTDITKLIKRDLDKLPQAKSEDFYTYWESDQDLLTKRIKETAIPKQFINRGKIHNGLAQGRVDRGEWSLFHNGNYIDCHQHRELYKIFKKTDRQEIVEKKWREHTAMLQAVWPNENFKWYFHFLEKFAALV